MVAEPLDRPTGEAVPRVIAIDGPSGVGKSTVARRVAEALCLPVLDTGAMYRALGLQVLRRGVDPADEKAVVELVETTEVDVRPRGTELDVLLEGQPVGEEIRQHAVSEITSRIATYSAVRRRMVTLQRRAAEHRGAVVEGRDIGTVVFPDTRHKFFLHARPAVRAERRWQELTARGENVDRDALERDIERRDRRDSQRTDSPLRHDGSYRLIDTSERTIDQVVAAVLETLDEGAGGGSGKGPGDPGR